MYDDDQAHCAITFESLSDYQLADLYESQSIEIEDSMEELPSVLSHMPGSRSPSLLSQGTPSRNASVRSSRASANSLQSTPKMLRLPHIHALRPVRVFKTSPENLPHNKETLKRTASHTPDATRPTMCSLLPNYNTDAATKRKTSKARPDRRHFQTIINGNDLVNS